MNQNKLTWIQSKFFYQAYLNIDLSGIINLL